MQHLLTEAQETPTAALDYAQGVSEVRTPEHLVPLREVVRRQNRSELNALFAAINERFGATEPVIGVFYAAGEMAVMAEVGRSDLEPQDRRLLRQLWAVLRHAQSGPDVKETL
ncbi:hypothetical protein DKT69_23410 [Micromonospora sicca]|uniref:Uncharacterized protein n=1 Tax=Micromonospora sicca TaxID=2202420 RepID=A0A317DCN1_9ACTN|nr:hypothetical protein [Micromonospora sp. 4G51]PWR12621.1 hypothetical protein DKT69_23410 [Micromonospora sp. 4G51]